MLSAEILISLSCILTLFYLYSVLKKWNDFRKRINLMPGPKTLPLLGNMLELSGSQDKIFKNLRRLIKEFRPKNVARSWIGHVAMVNIFKPDDVELIISSTKHNTKSEIYNFLHCWLGTGLLTSEGSKWQTRRKILTPSFHFNILNEFLPVFVEQTDVLVDILRKKTNKSLDIVPHITEFTLHSICETAMGISLAKSSEQDKYKKAVYKMGEFVVYRITKPWFFFDFCYAVTKEFWQQKHTAKYLHDFSYNVIEGRKNKLIQAALINNNDKKGSYSSRKKLAMLDMLLSAKLEGAPIDDEGIREEVDTFMFEGHDTTSMSICFTLMLIACHKDIQDKIYEEISTIMGDSHRKISFADLQELKYMERCIKESLRLYPSVPLISRITNEDVTTTDSYVIPGQTTVNIHIYDMHRNPAYFENPDSFDPDRFLPENTQKRHPFAYIPFSAGPRNCIGQKFALLEMKTVISGILRNFILEPLDTPDSLELITDLVLRPKNGIKLRIIERENVF